MTSGKLLIDTNIVSYLLKNSPYARPYLQHLKGNVLYISFITLGEIYYWAETAQWGEKRRADLAQRLNAYITVPFEHETARVYARIAAGRKRIGRPINLHDAWIAACAIQHDIPLVTHNGRDFGGIPGLQVITESL